MPARIAARPIRPCLVEAALTLLLADSRAITADAVKLLVSAATTIDVPDLAPHLVDLGAYDALLASLPGLT